jgi:hypothetical protein
MAPAGTGSSARSLTISAASFTRSGRGRLSKLALCSTFDFGGPLTGPHNALSLFPNLPASGPLSIFSATVRCRSGLALLRRRTYACFGPFPSGLKSSMFRRESAYSAARLPIAVSTGGHSASPFCRSGRARAFHPMPTCLHHTLLNGGNGRAVGRPQPRLTAASSSRGGPARPASPPNSARTSSECHGGSGGRGRARHWGCWPHWLVGPPAAVGGGQIIRPAQGGAIIRPRGSRPEGN